MTAQPEGQFLIYQTEDEELKIEVRLEAETVWLSQQHMATLFQTSKQNVSLHLRNIFAESELREDSVVKESLTTAADGKSYRTKFYGLDAIICVGYRVKSTIATRFRIWATQKLREYIVKGFVLDDERLKNPDQPFDYFDELLRQIQDIRTSERRFYQKITDIYATSIDYDPTQPESIEFFKTVQNKMHWAVTGQTAAEIIQSRADSKQPNMGLTTWRGAKVRKQDVTIAKNYLSEEELASLNNLVEQYLIFAEGKAMRRTPMHMKDWERRALPPFTGIWSSRRCLAMGAMGLMPLWATRPSLETIPSSRAIPRGSSTGSSSSILKAVGNVILWPTSSDAASTCCGRVAHWA